MVTHPTERKTDQPTNILNKLNIVLSVFRAFLEIVPGRRGVKRRMNIEILMCFFSSRKESIDLTVPDGDQFFAFPAASRSASVKNR